MCMLGQERGSSHARCNAGFAVVSLTGVEPVPWGLTPNALPTELRAECLFASRRARLERGGEEGFEPPYACTQAVEGSMPEVTSGFYAFSK